MGDAHIVATRMGSTSRKGGLLGLIYGDYWIKRKNLILAGFFIPLLFCFFLFSLFYFLYDVEILLKSWFFNIIVNIGITLLLVLFIISFFLNFILRFFIERSWNNLVSNILNDTWSDLYEERRLGPHEILVKNLCITIIRFSSKRLLYLLISIILLIPITLIGMYVGIYSYMCINTFTIDNVVNIIYNIMPFVGDIFKNVLNIITKDILNQIFQYIINTKKVYKILILTLLSIVLLPIADLIQSKTLKKQRGTILSIMLNGLIYILNNLNLPEKISNFFYITLLCLFTDQDTVSLYIPIINDRNLDDSIHKILGINQACFVTRISVLPQEELLEELERLPKKLQDEIMSFIEEEKIVIPEYQVKLARARRGLKFTGGRFFVYGIGENGCIVFADVRVPHPSRMTRIISRLWCSDPVVKDRIIEEINKLEGT